MTVKPSVGRPDLFMSACG